MDVKDKLICIQATADIVAAYVAKNPVNDLNAFIRQVHATLIDLATTDHQKPAGQARPEPAVPINKSVTPDYIVCLEDGKKLKMLKRYIKSAYNMTPEEYRAKWGLPADYPMVAPNYAARRSRLAREIGLGTNNRGGK
jgi:predicted transcriptional regulator